MCQLPPDSQLATASQFSPLFETGGASASGGCFVPTFSTCAFGAVTTVRLTACGRPTLPST